MTQQVEGEKEGKGAIQYSWCGGVSPFSSTPHYSEGTEKNTVKKKKRPGLNAVAPLPNTLHGVPTLLLFSLKE